MVSHRYNLQKYSHVYSKVSYIPHNYKRVSASQKRHAMKYKTKKCKTCGKFGKTVLDHCHATGRVRGWLCDRCNLALGHVYDNIHTLRNLITYLDKPFEASMAKVKQELIKKAKLNGGVIFRLVFKQTQ